ncbi:MAG: cyclase family protein [Bacteroidetes bacterium]|nr:cyclase family protein [Bacteroidota bacterium]
MKIDITHKLKKDNPVFEKFNDSDKNYLNFGHIGTHLDSHLQTVIPLEYISNRGILINVSGISNKEIMIDNIDISNIREKDFVIFQTNEMEKYGYGTTDYFADGIELSHELIDCLITKKVRFIAIDALGVRNGKDHTPTDKKCEKNGIYVIENLDNLSRLSEQLEKGKQLEFTVHVMWMNYDGTGLPCRVIVEI